MRDFFVSFGALFGLFSFGFDMSAQAATAAERYAFAFVDLLREGGKKVLDQGTKDVAALEALASGTPVICRSEAAISEIITSNSGAHRPRNAAIWAETAQQFSTIHRDVLRTQCRARAEEFSWKKTADQLLSLDSKELTK